ncbi:hypothetical protein PFICI_00348 [Pestalotiopsis fici W106-1]|uniref:Heterokaryon incompatibility domain-containing protein n=1 Tax=Pestalotiopsis fici (strain W106-1 / CGMCC3.15140) TaxID=1229662 RepID=W3XKI6_PESFW|nr:uncharacterized protein PFICI_00348 [Pestalotiopsis fici W106-1]ETS86520.1 hypothetical protein PFICI_00348 [Pestalotiopsis fici W106-1]
MATELLSDEDPVRRRRLQDSTTPIIYTPLIPAEAQIRLLTLHPGPFDEDIRCSLNTASLKSVLQYEALSYVWGDPADTLPVVVDGSEIQVTTNLEAALRHLRWQEKARTLWADAICINQNDTEEKTVQVPMMGDIYRQATSVVVWLGHGLEHVDVAVRWAQLYLWKQERETPPGSEANVPDTQLTLVGFCNSRPWFHPLAQAPLLASYVDIPRIFIGYKDAFFKVVSNKMAAFSANPDLESLAEQNQQLFTTMTREYYKHVAQDRTAWSCLYDMIMHNRNQATTTENFPRLLVGSVGKGCSEPRDRMYALYGLCPNHSSALPVDYKKTQRQVILETITHITSSRFLYFLWTYLEFHADRFVRPQKLPSWTPDFDRRQEFINAKMNGKHGLRFVDRRIEADHISPDLTTLHLWARNLGYCKILRRLSDPGPVTKIPGQKADITFEFAAFIKDLRDNEPSPTGHELCQRFARRAVIDNEGHEQTSDDDLVEAFKAVHSDPSLAHRGQNGEFKSRALELVSRSRSCLRGVACIVTSNGCVGFSPYDTEDDDLVVVPRFPNPLMVLRKEFADPNQGGRHSYLMVGVANVDVDAVGVAESHGVDVVEYLVR